ncbi:MAG: HAD-IIA family hydrolase [Campylobacter sp.]|nr:HAD-IIA family hydrolase [Campylobacter sp.]
MSKAVIFDLDGTVYFGNKIADGVIRVIDALQNNGYNILFFTNNSTKSRAYILEKLLKLGIQTELKKIYTSSYATVIFLKEHGINDIFLIGSNDFNEEIMNEGIRIVDENHCNAVVVGLDINFNYYTLSKGLLAVKRCKRVIASNIDKNYPVENNIIKPGANAMVSALLGSIGSNVSLDVIGKPNCYMLEILCKDWQLDKRHIYVVGDSIESDIAMANNFGCKSILVGNNMALADIKNIILGDNDECVRI